MNKEKLTEVEFLRLENIQLKILAGEAELKRLYNLRETLMQKVQNDYSSHGEQILVNLVDGSIERQIPEKGLSVAPTTAYGSEI